MKNEIKGKFHLLCEQAGRNGLIGFVPVKDVRLFPVQEAYLRHKLAGLGPWSDITAISISLLYQELEILAIPAGWVSKPPEDSHWNRYAHAYTELNRLLNEVATRLTEHFGGMAECATLEACIDRVSHVNDYFPHCVSHRAFAETAGVGWRGRHGLVVTPEAGPALRFATIFIPQPLPPDNKHLPGCRDCSACLDVCHILRREEGYREKCRRWIKALGLDDEVCGICVRACWETVRGPARLHTANGRLA